MTVQARILEHTEVTCGRIHFGAETSSRSGIGFVRVPFLNSHN